MNFSASRDTPYLKLDSSRSFLRTCLWRNLIVALLYLLVGGGGMLLTFSSGYSSPLWPAVGVAVAAVLIWGGRCWPGIWLGSLLVDLSFDFSMTNAGLAALTASGATVQVLLCAWLVRRYLLQDRMPFSRDWGLGLFLIVAGPLACLLSSSFGTATLFFGGKLDETEIFSEWLRWWSGDTLGVLLFTPLTLLLWPGAHPYRLLGGGHYRFALPLIVTTVLLVLGYLGLSQLNELRALPAASG